MTICPCCGFKFSGSLTDGCTGCGARAIGEPLPRPANELPSYGRALVLTLGGSLVVLVFVVQTILAMAQRSSGALERLFQFWQWVAAAETAAWQLKWISIPVMFVTLWLGLKLYKSIKAQPEKFCGLKYARRGLLATSTVGFLIALLIGVTVPERLRQRELASDASFRDQGYTLHLALAEYQNRFNTLPDQATLKEDLAKLPDPYGQIAAALRELEAIGYEPRGEVAAVNTQKARSMRDGAIMRRVGLTATDDSAPAGLALTEYELRLPGKDKILGTEDDWIVRNGIVKRLADDAKGGVGRRISAGAFNR